jgi:Trk K+ transport system NAD-binding subunit
VVIEPREDQVALEEAVDVHRAHVVHGDVTNGELLSNLRLDRAQRVVLLTGDDFANLEAAAKIRDIAPDISKTTIAHVSDLRFLRAIATGPVHAQTFNVHQIAASHLVQEHLLAHFDRTEPLDLVVLAGFGRFGQTVLDELQKSARGKFHTVVIVDMEATRGAAVFETQIGFVDGYERVIMDRDLRDPLLWNELDDRFSLASQPVIVLGCGDGGVNLRTALTLSPRYPKATIIARSFQRSVFAEQMSSGSNLRAFSVAELVTQSMPREWFRVRR